MTGKRGRDDNYRSTHSDYEYPSEEPAVSSTQTQSVFLRKIKFPVGPIRHSASESSVAQARQMAFLDDWLPFVVGTKGDGEKWRKRAGDLLNY